MIEICEQDKDEREYQADWSRRKAMMRKIMTLARECEFEKEYDIGDGITVSFHAPSDE